MCEIVDMERIAVGPAMHTGERISVPRPKRIVKGVASPQFGSAAKSVLNRQHCDGTGCNVHPVDSRGGFRLWGFSHEVRSRYGVVRLQVSGIRIVFRSNTI